MAYICKLCSENGLDIAKYANENIYMFGNDVVDATIKINSNYATACVDDWYGKSARFYNKDGEIYCDIKTNETSLIYWCLQYGKYVELVSPYSCREKIKNIIENMKKTYEK